LALDPAHAASALGASTAALQLGRPAAALAFARRALERAVALEPENAEFRGALDRFRRGTLSR
jgi:hypothetical protein